MEISKRKGCLQKRTPRKALINRLRELNSCGSATGAEPSLVDLGGHPRRFDGFEFSQPAARLNVLRDDFVDGLSTCERSQQSRTEADR